MEVAKWRVYDGVFGRYFKTKKEANAYAEEVYKKWVAKRRGTNRRPAKRPEVEAYDHAKADPFSPSFLRL